MAAFALTRRGDCRLVLLILPGIRQEKSGDGVRAEIDGCSESSVFAVKKPLFGVTPRVSQRSPGADILLSQKYRI